MKEWQHGIDLDVLLAIESLYEKYNSYSDSPFKQIKKNNIAEALHNGDLKVLYKNGIPISSYFSHRSKVSTPIYMYGDTLIGERIKNDLTLSCFAGEKLWHLERLREYKFENTWLQVWAEDKESNDLAIKAGYTYVFGKITTFGEIISIYFRDSVNSFYKRQHPFVHSAEKKNIFKLADVPSQCIESMRTKIENMNILYSIHYSKYNREDSWSAISLRGYSDDSSFIEKPSVMNKKWKEDNVNKVFELQDTVMRKQFPEVDHLIASLGIDGALHRIRFMRLAPGNGELSRHTDQVDSDMGVKVGNLARIHFPIITNDDVIFTSWNYDGSKTEVNMKENECWYLDIRKPHKAINQGITQRIHLVIDLEVTEDFLKKLQ
jgi:hypothetical protein